MIKEHDRIVLTCDLAEEGLKTGDVGTVIHIHKRGAAFEVEFLTLDGQTAAIATLTAAQVRHVRKGEINHARQPATA